MEQLQKVLAGLFMATRAILTGLLLLEMSNEYINQRPNIIYFLELIGNFLQLVEHFQQKLVGGVLLPIGSFQIEAQ